MISARCSVSEKQEGTRSRTIRPSRRATITLNTVLNTKNPECMRTIPSSLLRHSVAGGKTMRSRMARSCRRNARSRFGLVWVPVESKGKAPLSAECAHGAGRRTCQPSVRLGIHREGINSWYDKYVVHQRDGPAGGLVRGADCLMSHANLSAKAAR